MKRRFFKKFLYACFLTVLIAGTSQAEGLNFSLVNRSGFTISKIFLSPYEVANWNRDHYEISENFPVIVGEKVDVSTEDLGYRFWNVRVALDDGRQWEYHNVDLSSIKWFSVNVDGRAFDDSGKYYDFPKQRIRPVSKYQPKRSYRTPRRVRYTPRHRIMRRPSRIK